jgi:branched-chain amino acid transport system ATP-binding protein
MLRLEKVRVRFHDQIVLRDINMDVPAAQTTILIGRNGAGKTTTLRAIMGVLPLEGGRIWLDDIDLTRVPSHDRARLGVGYAPEDRRLIPDFSVEDNLLLPAVALRFPADLRRRRLDEVFTLLPEVAAIRARAGGVLSGGQGKMVVLLDEPFQGLAPALALTYADTLVRLRKSRLELGLLVTESTPRLLDKIVDHSLLIERGEIGALSREAA